MFKRALFGSFVFAAIVAVSSCHDSSDSGTGPEIPTVEYADFVFFDTTQFYVAKGGYESTSSTCEIYLWWEENFGEPFIDINDNGIYEPGVDEFIMCSCDTNQDLNHNGRYDGPDDPWEPGIPFDDIDGNGELRYEGDYPSCEGGPNVPYFDGNRNGVLDTDLAYNTLVLRPRIAREIDSRTVFEYAQASGDSVLYYVSDSGVTYQPTKFMHTFPIRDNTYYDILYTDSTGLYYGSAEAELVWGTTQLFFQLLPIGPITNDTATMEFSLPDVDDPPTYFRQIWLDQTLELNGVSYTALLKVRCDQVQWPYEGPQTIYTQDAYWEFYFSEELGIAAIREKPKAHLEPWQFSFEKFDEPFPILLQK